MPTLLITHPACLQHLTPAGHPERPDRLRAIERALAHERFQELVRVEAPAAALETLALCHPMQYVTAVRDATPKDGLIGLDADTTMSPGSFEAALRAAGGAVHAVDEVMAGKVANAFVATRPPGHHPETARPTGVCLFNNAAIAARYAQRKHGLERAAGVDAHMRDPLANLNLLETDFDWATRKLMEVADASANGRVLSVLEGGYDLEGLANSVAAHVAALMQG